MRKTLNALLALNLVLAASLAGAATLRGQTDESGADSPAVFDCCKASTSGVNYCCDRCCWNPMGPTCDKTGQCR